MAKRQAETGVSAQLRQWLEMHGWRCFRHNAIRVVTYSKGGKRVTQIVKGNEEDKGLGDLLAFRHPHMMVVEAKREGGTLQPSQKKVLADERVSPFCVVAESLEDLRAGMAAMGIPERV